MSLNRKIRRLLASQWGWPALAAVVIVIFGPLGSPKGTGLEGKTWWDWLDLAGVPATLAGVGIWFQQQQRKRDAEEAKEDIMQIYFDRISSLLIEERLIDKAEAAARRRVEASASSNEPDYEDALVESAKDVIRARTLQIIRRLEGDSRRQSMIFRFLCESHINDKLGVRIGADLSGQDFTGVKFFGANLSRANLVNSILAGADLFRANLAGADLTKADLSNSCLVEAKLYSAKLIETDLRWADLRDATLGIGVSRANFTKAKFKDTICPNGGRTDTGC